jgi:FkbM family methyltransferase
MNQDTALVRIADLYLYFFRYDYAYKDILKDARAEEILDYQVTDLWQLSSVDSREAWPLKGLGLFSLASIHHWRNGIDFLYLDVGANVGLTTIVQAIFCKRCGHNNVVYAFEPGRVFSLLRDAVNLNRVSDIVTCVNAAVSDEVGPVNFYVTPAQSPASSLLTSAVDRPDVSEKAEILVDAITIDSFLERKDWPGAILAKIDAEGADFLVLDGMKKTIANHLCTIQIEFIPSLVESYTDPVERILSLVKEFEIVDVGTSQHAYVTPNLQSVSAFVQQVRTRQSPTTDLFLVPRRMPKIDTFLDRII